MAFESLTLLSELLMELVWFTSLGVRTTMSVATCTPSTLGALHICLGTMGRALASIGSPHKVANFGVDIGSYVGPCIEQHAVMLALAQGRPSTYAWDGNAPRAQRAICEDAWVRAMLSEPQRKQLEPNCMVKVSY
jgi:hypothetical protein